MKKIFYLLIMCLSVSSLCAQIKIIEPLGGEIYNAGTDLLIKWEGIEYSDTVRIEYSPDFGKKWIEITDTAYGYQYLWKNVPFSHYIILKLTYYVETEGAPVIEWERSYGGSSHDVAHSVQQTYDGGYIVGAGSSSQDYDVSHNNGFEDFWILKLNGEGDLEWENSYGGKYSDQIESIIQTSDSNYVAAGCVSYTRNHNVAWMFKIDQSGNLLWENRNDTGSSSDFPSVKETKDRGYICAGSGYGGHKDSFIIKYDHTGNEEWRKFLGCEKLDHFFDIDVTHDGGYIAIGELMCLDDLEYELDYFGYCAVKFDSIGNVQWQKTYGDSLWENSYSIEQTYDRGYIMGGHAAFTLNDPDRVNNFSMDFWIVKTDSLGNYEWQKKLGGTSHEGMCVARQTKDSGYVATGMTTSQDGDISANNGAADYWVVKLDKKGNLEWEKCYGGSSADLVGDIKQTNDGGYIVVGSSSSSDKDVSENKGKGDAWIVKLSHKKPISDTSRIKMIQPEVSARGINLGDALWCAGKDTVIHDWIVNTGEYEVRIDSIAFEGEYAGDFSYEHDFPFTIHPGRNEDIMFGFHPDSAGGRSAKIIIYTQADTLEYTIRAEGLEPELLLLSDSIDFGNVCVNNNDTLNTILIKNTGELEVEITNIFLDDPVSRFALIDGGTAVLAPDSTLSLSLSFAPKEAELLENTLIIEYECMPKPLDISLKGLGVLPEPELLLDEIDFGSVCLNSADTMLTAAVRNMGTSPIDFTEIYFEHPAFNLIEPSVPLTIQPDSVMMIRLSFKPETIEKIADTLKLSYKCSEEPLSIVMRGEGYASELDIVKDILEFGEVCQGQTETLKFTINNKGENEIAYINLRLDNQAVTDYEINSENPVGPLAPGSSAEIEISFTPGNIGEIYNSLIIEYECMRNPELVYLSGTGINPSFTIINNNIDFGEVLINENSELSEIIFENNGKRAINITNIIPPGLPFGIIDGGNNTIRPNENLELEIKFSPEEAKSFRDSIVIEYECMEEPLVVYLEGRGTDEEISVSLEFPEVWGEIGKRLTIPLYVQLSQDRNINVEYEIQAAIPFDAFQADQNVDEYDDIYQYLTLSGTTEITGDKQILHEIPGKVYFGKDNINPIKIISYTWKNTDISTTTRDGILHLNLDSLCIPDLRHVRHLSPTKFTVQPNPATGSINISITAEPETPLTVSLYDVQGTRIHTQALSSTGADNISIDATSLGSGIYQLIIQSLTEMKSQTVGVVR